MKAGKNFDFRHAPIGSVVVIEGKLCEVCKANYCCMGCDLKGRKCWAEHLERPHCMGGDRIFREIETD